MKLTYDEIISSMKKTYSEKCGYVIEKNSSEEKAVEAFASELYALSCYGDFILKQAFVQTATDKYLESHGELRGCVRKSPEKAQGILLFSMEAEAQEDTVIEVGTICSVEDYPLIQYETIEQGVIKAGSSSIYIKAQAVEFGEKYNVAKNKITVMVNSPIGVASVTNPSEFNGGYNGESDSAYRRRIIDTYKLPSFEFSKKTLENRVKQIEGITDCILYDTDTPNRINVMVATKNDMLEKNVSESVIECIGFAELIGASVNVCLALPKAVDLTVDMLITPGKDDVEIKEAVFDIVEQFFSESSIGKPISVSDLTNKILKIKGTEKVDIYCDSIMGGYIYCPQSAYIKLGSLEVYCRAK